MGEKTQLEPYEVVMAYIANRHQHVEQNVIAQLFNINVGRITEAVIAIEWTIANLREVYRMAKAEKGENHHGAQGSS